MHSIILGERTGLVVRASDSGSGDTGSIGVGSVCCFLEQETFTPLKVLVIPRNRWLRLNMTEKLFTGTLNHNQNKTKAFHYFEFSGHLHYVKVWSDHDLLKSRAPSCALLINTETPKVTYYYVLILNLNLKYIINFLKVISISKDYFICHHQERLV